MDRYRAKWTIEAGKVTSIDEDACLIEYVDIAGKKGAALVNVCVLMDSIPAEALNGGDLGYVLRFPDGYIDWLPTDAFETSYELEG